MLENYIGNSVLSFHLGFLLTIHGGNIIFCSVTSESAGRVVCFALQFFVSLMCHIKNVCVPLLAFSAHIFMYEWMYIPAYSFSLYMQIPKASFCTESKSQKSYALVGFPELTILTLADSKREPLAVIFFYKLS